MILAKFESINDRRNQQETKLSWSKLAALKQKRITYKELVSSYSLGLTSNRFYSLYKGVYEVDKNITHNGKSKQVKPLQAAAKEMGGNITNIAM